MFTHVNSSISTSAREAALVQLLYNNSNYNNNKKNYVEILLYNVLRYNGVFALHCRIKYFLVNVR